MPTSDPVPSPVSPGDSNETPQPNAVPLRDRILDLIALIALLGLAAIVYACAGATALSVVMTAGIGVFSAWRHHR